MDLIKLENALKNIDEIEDRVFALEEELVNKNEILEMIAKQLSVNLSHFFDMRTRNTKKPLPQKKEYKSWSA